MIRPADGNETRAAWKVAMETTDAPTILVLSRQTFQYCLLQRSSR